MAGCGLQEPAATPVPLTTATTAPPVAPADTAATTPSTTIDPGLPAAPWSGPPLPAEAVPALLAEQWEAATNKGFCAALYPADANDLAPDAVVRTADFGADAWAIAWDRPEGPGRGQDGNYCDDCGRGAFGVAGTAGLSPEESVAVWSDRLEWSDDSAAGYGIEGMAEPDSGAPHLAFLSVAGQGCVYNVWSFLGEDHLLDLLAELRFVEGMLAAVIDDDPAVAVEALGPAPWSRAAVGDAAVAAPLLSEWSEEVLNQEMCPLLNPVALGDGTDGARARRAESYGELLAAWDLPAGPGRYGSGEYCADCGRGALGLGTIARFTDAPGNFERFAVTHTWDDGSELRVISEATQFFDVPADRAEFTDPETGQPAVAPYNAFLTIPGLGCGYRLWSFLGPDHVVGLAQNLRPVVGFGDQIFTEGVCAFDAPRGDFQGDGIIEAFESASPRDAESAASILICPQDGAPPNQVFVPGEGGPLSLADVDGDNDVEIVTTAATTETATFAEIYTEGEANDPTALFVEDGTLLLIEGIVEGKGYLWGCRDDGTLVQVEGALSGGSFEWVRTSYRVEGIGAVVVGEGAGTTAVTAAKLTEALDEAVVRALAGAVRCGG